MIALNNHVAIVGGGLAGTSLAYYLSLSGWQVTLLDSGSVGASGATGASRGIVRVYDPQPEIMTSALAGVRAWRNLKSMAWGMFTECGCIYLLAEENVDSAKKALEFYKESDYPMEFLQGPEAIKSRVPMLQKSKISDKQWAIWEPKGGYVNTRLAAQVLAQQARLLGALILENVTVSSLSQTMQGAAIATSDGSLHANYAVLATGARLPELQITPGVFCRTIPLTLLRNSEHLDTKQCVIDETLKAYIRPENGAYFFAGGAAQYDGSSIENCETQWKECFAQNRKLASEMLNKPDLHQLSGVCGYDAYTENFEPVLTPFSQDNRIGVVAGFSGRGAKYIPAAANQYSDIVTKTLQTKPTEEHSSYA